MASISSTLTVSVSPSSVVLIESLIHELRTFNRCPAKDNAPTSVGPPNPQPQDPPLPPPKGATA